LVVQESLGFRKCSAFPSCQAVHDGHSQPLARLGGDPASGPILRGPSGKPLNLENLSERVVSPLLKTVGREWHGWYSLRRGVATTLAGLTRDGMASKGAASHKSCDHDSALCERCARKHAFSDGAARKVVQRMCSRGYREAELVSVRAQGDSNSRPLAPEANVETLSSWFV
jgi:hypothetical protein